MLKTNEAAIIRTAVGIQALFFVLVLLRHKFSPLLCLTIGRHSRGQKRAG